MRTKTMAVAQVLCGTNKRGTAVFNDKLADGTRSLKVWHWLKEDYEAAKAMLELWGCKVALVEKEKYSARGGRYYTMRRLHVQENN